MPFTLAFVPQKMNAGVVIWPCGVVIFVMRALDGGRLPESL